MTGKPLYVRGGRRPAKKTTFSRVAAGLLVLLAIVVNYFVFFRGAEGEEVRRSPALEVTPSDQGPRDDGGTGRKPGNHDDGAEPGEEESDGVPLQVFAGELQAGDRMLDALARIGLDRTESRRVIRAMDRVFDFRRARPGDRFRLMVDPTGAVAHFSYTRSALEIYEVNREDGAYLATKRDVRTVVEPSSFGCVLRGGFRKGLLRCARDAGLAEQVTNLLAPAVDFAAESRDGDELRVVVEKLLADGEFLRYGRVLAIDYRGKLAQVRFYLHASDDTDGEAGGSYFLADGGSVARRFLRTPIRQQGEGAYAGGAIRPALHRYKRHTGLDYPVPKGTPVVSVGEGTISHAGPKGSSGTLVAVRHRGGVVSYYAHLSRLASGLKKGRHVAQGDVIAYSGDSGRTSDPRLHFAVKVRGRFVNPLERPGEPTSTVPDDEREAFEATARSLDTLLNNTSAFDAELDS